MAVDPAFIAALPKAELHVHHVGSASPRIVSELARRHPGVVPSGAVEGEAVTAVSCDVVVACRIPDAARLNNVQ